MIIFLEITVIAWLLIMGLVLVAFRRSAMVLSGSGIHHIMAGVFWIICASVLRGVFWDVVPHMVDIAEFHQFTGLMHPNTWPNIFFYAVMGIAGIRLMYGFWMMLPEEDRKDYNIFTAAFYPKKLRIIIKEKSE